jgi:thioredoxin reductase (NADPH)
MPMAPPPAQSKPVILVVDDDPAVLRAVEGDVRRRYAERYRVIRAESGVAALRTLEALAARGDAVAMILTDQRMPGMTGVELLERGADAAPGAKRVLLTAYADTDVAIRAINAVHLDHYLLKPWDPPEQHLYPVADDLLDDWSAGFRPVVFHGVRVVSDRWSPDAHRIRAFLARHQVPFRWLDAEGDGDARRLLETALPAAVGGATRAARLPLVLIPDGTTPDGIRLEAPTVDALAEALGLQTRPARPFYDLVIVGGGPSGLAAAVYGASEGLDTLLIEREGAGGQAGESSRIENYLGFPVGLSGADLARRGLAQVRRFGAEVLAPQEACRLRADGPYRVLTLASGEEVSAHAVVLAMGVAWRSLGAPGVERLGGAGVYYGASPGEAP